MALNNPASHPVRYRRIGHSLAWLCGLTLLTSLTAVAQPVRPGKADAPWVGQTLEGLPCRGRQQGYGPYDYTRRVEFAHNLKIVEQFHFTPPVEQLVRGENGSIPGDIDYTLSAWPNHHRALNAISRYDLGYPNKKHQPSTDVECYFQKAISFSPRDSTARLLYGIYLHKKDKHEMALEMYESAQLLSPNEPQIKYNLGLLHVDMGQYDEAEFYARELYSNNFPLKGLKRKLESRGYLKDTATPQG